ncbi:hypothetical protein HYH02_008981 [Chlamydomonas schloesseri]|uniref:Uncharacterized protein n=1 Tax=Chlamydomonas schloesseri TaxID=2026947 RepID=A0A835WD58_9CHLO|nr:hypothetical protein HYH02_008981 [Chlamydomonas schloesseri]|eukprot:KAG2445114.1 hypothetical protein HYH02_008981 [Chlamydomonas schloesseri]
MDSRAFSLLLLALVVGALRPTVAGGPCNQDYFDYNDADGNPISEWRVELYSETPNPTAHTITFVYKGYDGSTCTDNVFKWETGLPQQPTGIKYLSVTVPDTAAIGETTILLKGGTRYTTVKVRGPTDCTPPASSQPPLQSKTVALTMTVNWDMPNILGDINAGPCLGAPNGELVGTVGITFDPPLPGAAAGDPPIAFVDPSPDFAYTSVPRAAAASDASKWAYTYTMTANEGTTVKFTWLPDTDLAKFGGAEALVGSNELSYTITATSPTSDVQNINIGAFKIRRSLSVPAKIFYDLPPVVSPKMGRDACLALGAEGSPAANGNAWSVERIFTGGANTPVVGTYAAPDLTWAPITPADSISGVQLDVRSTDPLVLISDTKLRTSDTLAWSSLDVSSFLYTTAGVAGRCTLAVPTLCLTVTKAPTTVSGQVNWASDFGAYTCAPVNIQLTYTPVGSSTQVVVPGTTDGAGHYSFANLNIEPGTTVTVHGVLLTSGGSERFYLDTVTHALGSGFPPTSIAMDPLQVTTTVSANVNVYYDFSDSPTGACVTAYGAAAASEVVVTPGATITRNLDEISLGYAFTASVAASAAAAPYLLVGAPQYRATDSAGLAGSLCAPAPASLCLTVSKKPVTGKISWAGSFGAYSCAASDSAITVQLSVNGAQVATVAASPTATETAYTFPRMDIPVGATLSVTVDAADVHSSFTITANDDVTINTGTLDMGDIVISRVFEIRGAVKYDFGVTKAGDAAECAALAYGVPDLDDVFVTGFSSSSDLYVAGGTAGAFSYDIAMADITPGATIPAIASADQDTDIVFAGLYTSDPYTAPAAAPGGNAQLCTPLPITPCLAVGRQFTVTIEGQVDIELNGDVDTHVTGEQAATSACVGGTVVALYPQGNTDTPATNAVATFNADGTYTVAVSGVKSGDTFAYTMHVVAAGGSSTYYSVYVGGDGAFNFRLVDATPILSGGLVLLTGSAELDGPSLYITRVFDVKPYLSYDLALTATDKCTLTDAPRAQDVAVADSAAGALDKDTSGTGYETLAGLAYSAAGTVTTDALSALVADGSPYVTSVSYAVASLITSDADACAGAAPLKVCMTVGLKTLTITGLARWDITGVYTAGYLCADVAVAATGSPPLQADASTSTDSAGSDPTYEMGVVAHPGTTITLALSKDAAAAGTLKAASVSVNTDAATSVDDTKATVAAPDALLDTTFDVDGTIRYDYTKPANTASYTATCALGDADFTPVPDEFITVTAVRGAETLSFDTAYAGTAAGFKLRGLVPAAANVLQVSMARNTDAATPTNLLVTSPYVGSADLMALFLDDVCATDPLVACLTAGLGDLKIKVGVDWELTSSSSDLEGPTLCAVKVQLDLGSTYAAEAAALAGGSSTTTANDYTDAAGTITFTLVNALSTWRYDAAVVVPTGAVWKTYVDAGAQDLGSKTGLVPAASPATTEKLYITRTFDISGPIYTKCSSAAAFAACDSAAASPATADVDVSASTGTASYTSPSYTVTGLAPDTVTVTVSASAAGAGNVFASSPFTVTRDVNVGAAFKGTATAVAARATLCTAASPVTLATGQCLTVGKLVTLSGQLWLEKGGESPATYNTGTDTLFSGCTGLTASVTASGGASFVASGSGGFVSSWEGAITAADGTFTAPKVVAGAAYTVAAPNNSPLPNTAECPIKMTDPKPGYDASRSITPDCADAFVRFPRVEKKGDSNGHTHGFWDAQVKDSLVQGCTPISVTALVDVMRAAAVESYTDPFLDNAKLEKPNNLWTSVLGGSLPADEAGWLMVADTLMSDSRCSASTMKNMLKCQLASLELSWFWRTSATSPFYAFRVAGSQQLAFWRDTIAAAERMVAADSTSTVAEMTAMKNYIDYINNLSGGPAGRICVNQKSTTKPKLGRRLLQ